MPGLLASGPVMVHTDVRATMALVRRSTNRAIMLDAHLDCLSAISEGRDLWMPAFNYDFLSSRRFDPEIDPCQVGALNEVFRQRAQWRSTVPVFNFCGLGPNPQGPTFDVSVDPFDESSVFGQLAKRDGSILWYGAPFSAATFLHHAESVSGGPIYRYDKFFDGQVKLGNDWQDVTLKYHVRPLTGPVDYDWAKLARHALGEGVIYPVSVSGEAPVFAASARAILDFWVDGLQRDPYYFLDQPSRAWIEPKIQVIGRRFEIHDFEGLPNENA